MYTKIAKLTKACSNFEDNNTSLAENNHNYHGQEHRKIHVQGRVLRSVSGYARNAKEVS